MKIVVLVFSMLFGCAPVLAATDAIKQLEEMIWFTEEYPPYNFADENGQPTGIAVDVLMEIFKRLGINLSRKDLQIVPWARSYHYLKTRPGTALFSTTYTEERLALFKFVGPILPTKVSIIAPKHSKIIVTSPQDLNHLRVGTVRDDIGEQLALAFGVAEEVLEKQNKAYNMIRMLGAGRLDVIAYSEDIARFNLKKAGLNVDDFESVHVLSSSHMGYTFHKSTDSSVLAPLQETLSQLREEGTLEQIIMRYLQ